MKLAVLLLLGFSVANAGQVSYDYVLRAPDSVIHWQDTEVYSGLTAYPINFDQSNVVVNRTGYKYIDSRFAIALPQEKSLIVDLGWWNGYYGQPLIEGYEFDYPLHVGQNLGRIFTNDLGAFDLETPVKMDIFATPEPSHTVPLSIAAAALIAGIIIRRLQTRTQ
jgi:hypothetical protein